MLFLSPLVMSYIVYIFSIGSNFVDKSTYQATPTTGAVTKMPPWQQILAQVSLKVVRKGGVPSHAQIDGEVWLRAITGLRGAGAPGNFILDLCEKCEILVIIITLQGSWWTHLWGVVENTQMTNWLLAQISFSFSLFDAQLTSAL